MAKVRGNLVIYLFPYLFIDKKFNINKYTFTPSYTETFNKESSRVKAHLTRIAKSFTYKGSANIFQYTYGFTHIHNENEWNDLKKTLDELATLLRYETLSDERSGADFSNFDYAVIEINRPIVRNDVVYYQGVLNGANSLSFHYPDYKYCPNHYLHPYIYRADFNHPVFQNLLDFPKLRMRSERETSRILRSLHWFNKSFRADSEVDDYEKFINIAIAFETLFKSSESGILGSLTTGITTLLGESDEMIHWIKNFYEVRCNIVHGEEQNTINYKGKHSDDFHLNHIVYARKVFTKCIDAIMLSREKLYTEGLHKELISNERRLKEAKTVLKNGTKITILYNKGFFNNIESLSQRDISGNISDVIEIGNKLLPLIEPALKKAKDKDLLAKLREITSFKGTDMGKLAQLYSEFHVGYGKHYFGDTNNRVPDKLETLVLKGAIYSFCSYAGWKIMHALFNKKT